MFFKLLCYLQYLNSVYFVNIKHTIFIFCTCFSALFPWKIWNILGVVELPVINNFISAFIALQDSLFNGFFRKSGLHINLYAELNCVQQVSLFYYQFIFSDAVLFFRTKINIFIIFTKAVIRFQRCLRAGYKNSSRCFKFFSTKNLFSGLFL